MPSSRSFKRKTKCSSVPKNLKFFTKTMTIQPKIIKAIVKPICDQLERELANGLLPDVARYPKMTDDPHSVPHVDAVNVDGEELNIVEWLNKVYRGELFSNNNLIPPHEQIINVSMISNHELWLRVSEICIAEFHWTVKQVKTYKPNINDLLFRKKQDFYGGAWNLFQEYWMPFVAQMDDADVRDEIEETLKYGVDTASFSKKRTETKPAFFRSKKKPVVSIAVKNAVYRRQFRGRHPRKREMVKQFDRLRHGMQSTMYEPALLHEPVGFRPMLKKQFEQNGKVGSFPTSKAARECATTICEQLRLWLKMRAIEYVGRTCDYEDGQRLDLVNTILPLVVERFKPRLCLDGGPHLAIGDDKKINCELDTLTMVMNNLKKDDYLNKTDDANGDGT